MMRNFFLQGAMANRAEEVAENGDGLHLIPRSQQLGLVVLEDAQPYLKQDLKTGRERQEKAKEEKGKRERERRSEMSVKDIN